jgi:hypothetical protein
VDEPELIELLEEERAADRSTARGRERHLRRVAEEGASLAGALLDLAERGSSVTIRTEGGRVHHGVVVGVGEDFCVVRGAGSSDTYLRVGALATVRPQHGERHAPATGDRRAPRDIRLVELLATVAAERPRVAIVVRGGEAVAGELRAVGTDVVTLRLDGDGRGLCYVAAASIVEVAVSR